MPSHSPKRAILSALQLQPDFAPLATLRSLAGGKARNLLRWLDQSGLALIFLQRLQTHEATALISSELRHALRQRMAHNFERTREMLAEFRRINEAFSNYRITLAALKGFTLVPDFCEKAHLRHQVDFDFLVHPANVDAAAEALQSCGYSTARLSRSGESCFTTPLTQVPSGKDDLYAIQRHRQVDLHTSIWEDSPWIPLTVPNDCLRFAELHSIHGVRFTRLSLEDVFRLQVFHAFRHSFRSWVRLSWFLEISRFLEVHRDDTPYWSRMIDRAGQELHTKRIFALVLGFANRLFQSPIPIQLTQWTSDATTDSMRAWLDHFSVDWCISDWPGSMTNVLLTPDFVLDRRLRVSYWKSRLLPRTTQLSIGSVKCNSTVMFFRHKSTNLRYLGRRSVSHLKNLLLLPLDKLRWERALRAVRKGHAAPPDESHVGGVS